MKFTLETNATANLVRAHSPGEIRVKDHHIHASVILTAEEIVFDWPVHHVGMLTAEHLKPVLAFEPEVVVLGSGSKQAFPDKDIIRAIHAKGIGLEVMDTAAACRTFNILVHEERRVVAALIIE